MERDPDLGGRLEEPAGGVVGNVEQRFDREGRVGVEVQLVHRLAPGGVVEVPEELGVLLVRGGLLHPQGLLRSDLHLGVLLLDVEREVDKGRELLRDALHVARVGEGEAVVAKVADDLGPPRQAVHLPDGEGPGAVGRPVVALGALFRVEAAREHLDALRDDEAAVEADAELADDGVGLVLGVEGRVLEEGEGAGFGDGAEAFLRGFEEPELLECVAGVADELPDEDFLVCVEGVGHNLEQLLYLRLELRQLTSPGDCSEEKARG
ncbi:transcriptional regulator LeuO [Babesia caballi]|uniref:Transcriptional regulator LeuO n=1 Tax=Babesia caballi TaxID=5871 RepID=A0AAV4LR39_BABCB|nr:transcriptional regulator LeuO [Babesia caballi]